LKDKQSATTSQKWSGPILIGTRGVGIGLQLGVEREDLLVICETDEAVEQFVGGSKMALGANASGSVPKGGGRSVGAEITLGGHGFTTYSPSKGLFIGAALEASIVNDMSFKRENPTQISSKEVEVASDISFSISFYFFFDIRSKLEATSFSVQQQNLDF